MSEINLGKYCNASGNINVEVVEIIKQPFTYLRVKFQDSNKIENYSVIRFKYDFPIEINNKSENKEESIIYNYPFQYGNYIISYEVIKDFIYDMQ